MGGGDWGEGGGGGGGLGGGFRGRGGEVIRDEESVWAGGGRDGRREMGGVGWKKESAWAGPGEDVGWGGVKWKMVRW